MSESKIRINISTGEVEIVGSESFINSNVGLIQQIVGVKVVAPKKMEAPKAAEENNQKVEAALTVEEAPAKATKVEAAATAVEAPVKKKPGRKKKVVVEETATEETQNEADDSGDKSVRLSSKQPFEEYMKQFPADLKNGDMVLLAGYFYQKNSPENFFTTFKASKLIKEAGFELTNTSQYVKNNSNQKRIKAIEKNKFQVTKIGIDHLRALVAKGL